LRVFQNRMVGKIFGPKRDDKIKGDNMGEACNMHGGDKKCIPKCWSEDLKRSDQSEDPGIVEKIVLEWILGK